MKNLGWILMLGLALPAAAQTEKKKVDVVFVLDTTSSMGGLIEGAKRKIWSIANEIGKGKPAPEVRMGLVAFRDKGDAYVTKTFDLSKNLDKVYKELLELQAEGGGDTPEHVLKGLEEAVDKMSWSADAGAFKVIYLVGDAPAQLGYKDTPTMEQLAQTALRKGVVINSVQCGNDASASEQWRQLAKLSDGRYLAIAQDGGMAAVTTPYDDRLARLTGDLDGTMLAYGARRSEAESLTMLAAKVARAAPASAAADRAEYRSKGASFEGELDLAQAVAEKKVDLGRMKDADLPASLRGLKAEERAEKVAAVSAKREALKKEISELSLKRARFIAENTRRSKDSFDAQLVEALKAQAVKKGIVY